MQNCVLFFMHVMSKSNAISLIAPLKVLNDITIGNSFQGLNKGSYDFYL